MKKLLLLLFIASCSTVFGQTEQGKITVGAISNLTFSSSSVSGGPSVTSLRISPQGGYFVIDELAVGLSLEYQKNKLSGFDVTTVSAGPFARYYFLEGQFRPYGIATVQFGSTKQVTKSTFYAYGVGAGLAYFINDFISLDGVLSYNRATSKTDAPFFGSIKSTSGTIGFAVALNLFF